jgi:hypothetical protein
MPAGHPLGQRAPSPTKMVAASQYPWQQPRDQRQNRRGRAYATAAHLGPDNGTLMTATIMMGPAVAAMHQASRPTARYFSKVMTNTTSELPVAVIKELKGGFKNYIPLSLCTHKACSNATCSTDAFDTEIGMNDRGEAALG